MKKLLLVVAIMTVLSHSAEGASFGSIMRKVFTGEGGRRTSAIAVCMASMFDQQTTFHGLALGGTELNPVFYSNGTFHTNRFIGVKVGTCAGALVGEELVRKIPYVRRRAETYDRIVTINNWVGAGVIGGVAAHNQYLIKTVLEK